MGGGHAVHERQSILSTVVVIFHTFYGEGRPPEVEAGRGSL